MLGMVQTEKQEPTVEDVMQEADEQRREEVEGEDRKENIEPWGMSLVRICQFLAKAEE